jgi:hypothetical protein
MGTEAQVNRSRGLDGELEDLRPGRARSFAHNLGMPPSAPAGHVMSAGSPSHREKSVTP